MHNNNEKLYNDLRSCSKKIKVTLPRNMKSMFPFPLIAKGYKTAQNKYYIKMQMFKSQDCNPVKIYDWKRDTDVTEALETLARQFISEYALSNH